MSRFLIKSYARATHSVCVCVCVCVCVRVRVRVCGVCARART